MRGVVTSLRCATTTLLVTSPACKSSRRLTEIFVTSSGWLCMAFMSFGWLWVAFMSFGWDIASRWVIRMTYCTGNALQWRHNGRDNVSITSLTIVFSTVCSDADQIKHQSSASLAFVWGIYVNSPHKCFHLMTSSWIQLTDAYDSLLEPVRILAFRITGLLWRSPHLTRLLAVGFFVILNKLLNHNWGTGDFRRHVAHVTSPPFHILKQYHYVRRMKISGNGTAVIFMKRHLFQHHCHFDNFRISQWRTILQIVNISVSLI